MWAFHLGGMLLLPRLAAGHWAVFPLSILADMVAVTSIWLPQVSFSTFL